MSFVLCARNTNVMVMVVRNTCDRCKLATIRGLSKLENDAIGFRKESEWSEKICYIEYVGVRYND